MANYTDTEARNSIIKDYQVRDRDGSHDCYIFTTKLKGCRFVQWKDPVLAADATPEQVEAAMIAHLITVEKIPEVVIKDTQDNDAIGEKVGDLG